MKQGRIVDGSNIGRKEGRKNGSKDEAILKEVGEYSVRWMASRSLRGKAKRRDGSLKARLAELANEE